MTDDEEPVQQCTLDTAVDIPKALEAAAIEYLDVDEHRTIAICQSAILMVTATEDQATAARAFDVALWESRQQRISIVTLSTFSRRSSTNL